MAYCLNAMVLSQMFINRSLNRHHGVNPGYLSLTLGSSLRLRRNPRRLGDFWEFISRCIGFWETAVAVIVHSKKTVLYISSSWVKLSLSLSLSVSAVQGLLIPMDLLNKLVGSSM